LKRYRYNDIERCIAGRCIGALCPCLCHAIAFQQKAAGNTALVVLGLAVVFVFLVLAAQYERLALPLAIILIVPMCLLAAMSGVNLRGQDNNVLTQIGLVVLVALAAKNATSKTVD